VQKLCGSALSITIVPTAKLAARNSPADLRVVEVRGGFASLAAQGVQLLLITATTIVLSRLITPQDYGLFGIAFAIVAFLGIAKDSGIIAPVIQSQIVTHPQLDTLFWFTATGGFALMLASSGAASLAGWFFAEPRLVPLTRTLGLTLFIGGLSTPHRALLKRQMRFTLLATCQTIGTAAGCAAAIFVGWQGGGPWSLVGLYLVIDFSSTVLIVSLAKWVPGWPKRGTGIRPLLRFGGLVIAFDFLSYFNSKFDNLLVGWYLGPAALGFYDKAYQFLLLPINQIGFPVANVAQPVLSAAQNDPIAYRASVGRFLLLAASLGMPLTTFLYANTQLLVPLAFGAQWLPSVPVFRALAPTAFLTTITACTGWIFLSLGRARRQLPFAALTTVVTIGAFAAGLNWGAWGVALALSISRVVLFIPTLMFTCHGTPVQWMDLLRTCARPALAALSALVISLFTGNMWGSGLNALVMNTLIFWTAYVLLWLLPPGGLTLLRSSFLPPRLAEVSPQGGRGMEI